METSFTFQNSNGFGLVRIVSFALGDYLKSERANTIAWYDCRGSVGKYTTLLNTSETAKSNIAEKLQNALNSGETIDLDSIKPELETFASIFPAGDLAMTIYNESNIEVAKAKGYDALFEEWSVVFPMRTIKEREQQETEHFKAYFEKNLKEDGWVAGNIVDLTTSGFYDGYATYLIATQDEEELDPEIVLRYERLIQEGKRPHCLVYCSDVTDNGNYYVLDGHHKLKAYNNLQIRPHLLIITQMNESSIYPSDANTFDREVFDYLFPWQLKHIFNYGYSSLPSLQPILDNPENRFNAFVKNGKIKEYWINGKLKLKGFYKDNKPDGKLKRFYENGKKRSVEIYENGRQIRYLQSWYNTGEIQTQCKPKNDYLNGQQISYHRTGEISGRTLYKDGKIADGKSAFAYNREGQLTYESVYKNGVSIRSRWYKANGEIKQESGNWDDYV